MFFTAALHGDPLIHPDLFARQGRKTAHRMARVSQWARAWGRGRRRFSFSSYCQHDSRPRTARQRNESA